MFLTCSNAASWKRGKDFLESLLSRSSGFSCPVRKPRPSGESEGDGVENTSK